MRSDLGFSSYMVRTPDHVVTVIVLSISVLAERRRTREARWTSCSSKWEAHREARFVSLSVTYWCCSRAATIPPVPTTDQGASP